MSEPSKKLVVKDLGEFGLIERITEKLSLPDGVIGVGDDCAVVPVAIYGGDECNTWELLTTDMMVEGEHFSRDFTSAGDLGWKLLAVSLSDIAAMGGKPQVCVVNLQIPPATSVDWIEELYTGLRAVADCYKIFIVGGDTVSGQSLAFSVTATGAADSWPMLRSEAGNDDDLWVSGSIGDSFAGLSLLRGEIDPGCFVDRGERILKKHRTPEPRVALGRVLRERKLASSCVDISDGLLGDARHLAEASRVKLKILVDDIPFGTECREAGLEPGALLTGGEDYELLFTAAPEKRPELKELSRCQVRDHYLPKLTRIGAVRGEESRGDALTVVTSLGNHLSSEEWLKGQNVKPGILGYDHFSQK